MDRLALAGGSAALLDKAYYDEVNGKVIYVREKTAAALTTMGFEVVPSKANFLFIRYPGDLGQNGIGGAELLEKLRERGILVRHFNKPRTADYLRVSIGTDEDMDRFLDACSDIIKDNKDRQAGKK
jgi:histidinol-phosphate aminotransferase